MGLVSVVAVPLAVAGLATIVLGLQTLGFLPDMSVVALGCWCLAVIAVGGGLLWLAAYIMVRTWRAVTAKPQIVFGREEQPKP